jgi:hypothetical protein
MSSFMCVCPPSRPGRLDEVSHDGTRNVYDGGYVHGYERSGPAQWPGNGQDEPEQHDSAQQEGGDVPTSTDHDNTSPTDGAAATRHVDRSVNVQNADGDVGADADADAGGEDADTDMQLFGHRFSIENPSADDAADSNNEPELHKPVNVDARSNHACSVADGRRTDGELADEGQHSGCANGMCPLVTEGTGTACMTGRGVLRCKGARASA